MGKEFIEEKNLPIPTEELPSAEFRLVTGETVIIDAEDLHLVGDYNWRIIKRRSSIVVGRYSETKKEGQSSFLLKNIIASSHSGKNNVRVSNKNENSLDCRKNNLEIQHIPKSSFYRWFDKSKKIWVIYASLPNDKGSSKHKWIGSALNQKDTEQVIKHLEAFSSSLTDISHDILKQEIKTFAAQNQLVLLKKIATYETGTERIRRGGNLSLRQIEIKMPDGSWVPKHQLIWEQHNGKLPPNHWITFKDGNRLNCNLENLELTTLNKTLLKKKLEEYPEEVRPAVEILNRLNLEISFKQDAAKIKALKPVTDAPPPAKRKYRASKGVYSASEIETLKELYPTEQNEYIAELLGRTIISIQAKATTGLKLKKSPGFRAQPKLVYKPYSDHEVSLFRNQYSTTPDEILVKTLNRSLASIRNKAHALGLKKDEALRKKPFNPWEKYEVDFLKKYYASFPVKDVCEALSRKSPDIYQKANDLGLRRPKTRREMVRFSPEEDQLIRELCTFKSIAEIGLTTGRSERSIQAFLARRNLLPSRTIGEPCKKAALSVEISREISKINREHGNPDYLQTLTGLIAEPQDALSKQSIKRLQKTLNPQEKLNKEQQNNA